MPGIEAQLKARLAKLIAQPSVSSVDPAFDMSNSTVTDTLSNWFEAAGFAVLQQTVAEEPAKFNMLARAGPGDRGLVLSGHTDTVPYDANGWATDPFELVEREGRWFGLGSADMKCFFPLILSALDGFDPSRLKRSLVVLAPADEESTMNGARVLVESGEAMGAYALIGEPTDLIPINKHKGILIGRVEVTGRAGHSSNPALGANALDGMHDIMTGFKAWREEAAERYPDGDFEVARPTLNLGGISGGDSPNRICASCNLLFDVRLMPGMDVDATAAELREIVDAAVAGSGLGAKMSLPMDPVPPMLTPADSAIVRAVEELSGRSAATVAFATEGPFLNALGCDTVVFGPGDIDTAHQPNEWVAVDKVLRMRGILRTLIERFCCDD